MCIRDRSWSLKREYSEGSRTGTASVSNGALASDKQADSGDVLDDMEDV